MRLRWSLKRLKWFLKRLVLTFTPPRVVVLEEPDPARHHEHVHLEMEPGALTYSQTESVLTPEERAALDFRFGCVYPPIETDEAVNRAEAEGHDLTGQGFWSG